MEWWGWTLLGVAALVVYFGLVWIGNRVDDERKRTGRRPVYRIYSYFNGPLGDGWYASADEKAKADKAKSEQAKPRASEEGKIEPPKSEGEYGG